MATIGTKTLAEKYLKPYQGLKPNEISNSLQLTSRKIPKTLSGIETFKSSVAARIGPGRKKPKTLSGIETCDVL